MPRKKAGKEKRVKKASKEDVVVTHNKSFGIKILIICFFLVLLIILVYNLSQKAGEEEIPPPPQQAEEGVEPEILTATPEGDIPEEEPPQDELLESPLPGAD